MPLVIRHIHSRENLVTKGGPACAPAEPAPAKPVAAKRSSRLSTSPDAPIIVSNGVGVDSVELLVELHRLSVVPDAIVTALVGQGVYSNEHPRFYTYLLILEAWLAEVGFPPIQYFWYEMKRTANYFPYWSLARNYLANRTLPSISFRRPHSCSLKFKGAEIDRWVTGQYGERPLRQAQCRLCYRLVGYDLSGGAQAARFSVKPKRKGPRVGDCFSIPCSSWA
mgnify:CR=1 FL=1